jgi:hypothetical protein
VKNLTYIILNKENICDFAKERNELLQKAKAEWIFFVDSDEKVSNGLRLEVAKRVQEGGYEGFYVKRKIIFLGNEIGEDKVLRLAKRNAGKWVRKVHETWVVGGKTGTLKNYIIHKTADNLYDYVGKINSYSSIHAGENLKEGKQVSMLKIIFFPKIKFMESLLKGRGFVFSILQSFHSFLGWAKQWELQKS